MAPRSRRRVSPEVRQRRIFYRWLWLVYVPIALAPLCFAVALTGLLPRQAHVPIVALLFYDAAGIALLIERRRRHISVPIPRTLLIGLTCLGATGIGGIVLAWMGIDRLSTSGGPGLLEAGGFLLLLTALAPAFKLLDLTIRMLVRTLLRLSR